MARAIIVGAGIGGLATSIALRDTDVEAVTFEQAPELARVELGAGITLWPNAVLVLDQLGVGEEVRTRGAVLDVFEQRTRRGRLLTRWPIPEMARRVGAPLVGINRPDLHAALAAAGGDSVQAGAKVTDFSQSGDGVEVTLSDGRTETGDVLLAADGIDSLVRARMLGEAPTRYSGLTMWRANVAMDEADMPEVPFIAFWGAGAKWVAFRSGPGRLSWEGIVAVEEGGRDVPGETKAAIREHFRGFHELAHSIIEATDESDIFRTDVRDRPPDERWGEGRVTLLGDAAHAMTFAVGQGAAQALEDSVAIARALDGASDLEGALRTYERERIPRAARFQNLAWRLARAGAWHNPLAWGMRNVAFRVTSPMAWRGQAKDMTLEAA